MSKTEIVERLERQLAAVDRINAYARRLEREFSAVDLAEAFALVVEAYDQELRGRRRCAPAAPGRPFTVIRGGLAAE